MDLNYLIVEVEEYRELKFGRRPKFTRRVETEDDDDSKFARGAASKNQSAARRRSEMDAAKRKEQREKARKKSGFSSGVLGTMERKLGVDADRPPPDPADPAIDSLSVGVAGAGAGGGGGGGGGMELSLGGSAMNLPVSAS
jgi:hypothetical protein